MMILPLLFFSFTLKAESLDPNILKLKEQVDQEVKSQFTSLQCEQFKQTAPFSCLEFKTPSLCVMKKCTGKISGYDQSIDVFIPQKVNRLSIYFHGHVLAGYEKYSNSITESNDPSQLKDKICNSSSATIMPKSIGNCATFDNFFKTSNEFNQFIDQVSTATSIPNASKLPISISGHSGGGRTLARILNGTVHKIDGKANERIDQAIFYDGLYNSWQPDMIANWVKNSSGVKLSMAALSPIKTNPNLSPYTYSNLVLQKISGGVNLTQSSMSLSTKNYTKKMYNQNSNQVQVLTRPTESNHTQSHFDVIKETWSEINQKK